MEIINGCEKITEHNKDRQGTKENLAIPEETVSWVTSVFLSDPVEVN